MDSTLVAAYIGAGSAIVGVLLGSAITGVGSWYGRSRRRKNVRRVLYWEHAYNIGMLEQFWKQVNRESQPQGQFDPVKEFERNLRLTEENLDEWGRVIPGFGEQCLLAPLRTGSHEQKSEVGG